MKYFHKNSRRIENEVFILYMLDHELVTAFHFKKKSQLCQTFLFLEWNRIKIKPYSIVFT